MDFPEQKMEEYSHLDARAKMGQRHGAQAGDPIKGAKAMYELAGLEEPPLRVVVGSDAYKAILAKIEAYKENYTKYEKISNSTDVDGWKG